MDLDAKLNILMALAADDREGLPGADQVLPPRLRNASRAGVLNPLNIRDVRVGSGGARAKLLRILMTNACSFNCHYCPMRRDRNLPRTLLKPAEVVRIFLDALARGWVSGLFLTTGIPSRPSQVMDSLIAVLEMLRDVHGYRGYIHVKVVPGADEAQLDRITALATRVSINLETPCGDSLLTVAPEKQLATTLVALERVQRHVTATREELRAGRPADPLRPGGVAGVTMQFVVGATSDTDRAILGKAAEIHAAGGTHHAHFSAFRPIRDTPLDGRRATPALREHRLYQADRLIRRYRFASSEIVFDDAGNIPHAYDPKVAWALAHPDRFPLDVHTASFSELLRVPGVGHVAARRIVEQRRTVTIRGLSDLRQLGVVTMRAQGFLALRGQRLAAERWREQLSLWAPEEGVGQRASVYEFSPGTFR